MPVSCFGSCGLVKPSRPPSQVTGSHVGCGPAAFARVHDMRAISCLCLLLQNRNGQGAERPKGAICLKIHMCTSVDVSKSSEFFPPPDTRVLQARRFRVGQTFRLHGTASNLGRPIVCQGVLPASLWVPLLSAIEPQAAAQIAMPPPL